MYIFLIYITCLYVKWFGFNKSLLFSGHKCPYYAKDGLGILESPNFPGEYPTGVECHWRVRPNRNKRVLILISSISLDSNCGDLLTIRKTGKNLCLTKWRSVKLTKIGPIFTFNRKVQKLERHQNIQWHCKFFIGFDIGKKKTERFKWFFI